MKKTVVLLAAALVGLSGCASTSFDNFGTNLGRISTIQQAVDIIGMPDSKQTILEKDVYIWGNSGIYNSVTPITTTTTGLNGLSTTSTSYVSSSMHLSCEIKLYTPEGSYDVESYSYNGNRGACEPYMKKLYNVFMANQ